MLKNRWITEKKKEEANKHENVTGLCSNQGKRNQTQNKMLFYHIQFAEIKETMSSVIKDMK